MRALQKLASACLLVTLFLTVPASAEDGGEVRGRVVDSRGSEPLGRVQVQLVGAPNRTTTDADGAFSFSGVTPGEYVLHVSTVGYYVERQKFTLDRGETKSFEVVLTPSSFGRAESVDVVAEPFDRRREESASALTLEGNEAKNLASVLADDPLRAVQSLPGVSSNNDFSSEFSLRGASFDRIGLYLDGVLLHAPFHMVAGQPDHGSLTIFNGDLVDQMTLYEGAWPVRYSDRTAGMLAVDTRDGNRRQTQVRASASASNAGVMAEGPLGTKRRASWLVSFRKSYLQYLLNRIDFGTDEPALAFGFLDGQARLSFDVTPKHNLTLSLLDGFSSLDRTVARNQLGINSVMTSGYRFTILNLASRYTPNRKFLITHRFAWSRERGDAENRNNSILAADGYGEWVWHSDATLMWAGPGKLDFGGEWRRLRDDGYSNRFENPPAPSLYLDQFRGTAHSSGAYAQQSFAWFSGRVRTSAGLRFDQHSASPVTMVSPYASIAIEPFKATKLQFDWGQYAQFPELSQSFSIFGNVRLLPERAIHYEATIDQRLNERTRVRVEFYNRQDRDLLARPDFDPRVLANGQVFIPPANAPILNSQRGYARGMQVFLQRRSANGFTGWISYACGRAQIRDGRLGLEFPADFDQRHTVNVFASYRLRPTVNLSARWTYGSGFPIPGFYWTGAGGYFLATNRNGARIDAFERADVRVNKAYVRDKWKMTLFAEVVNLFNRTNRNFDSPGAYNTRTGSASLSFVQMFPILPSVGIVWER